jgi:formylglycine-generating enzyme
MKKAARAILVAVLGTTSACAGILGIEDRFFESTLGEGGGPDGNAETSTTDGGDGSKDDGSTAGCPTGMIATGAYCIDATEVTQRAYAKFLSETGNDAGGQISQCAANTTFVAPSTCIPFGFDPFSDRPMACVDWCDAFAYCAWAGKRLCGLVDGGGIPTDAGNLHETTADQWFAACSHQNDGFHKFPYGNAYDPGICNGADRWEGGTPRPWDAGSGACIGGYPGLHDMSGNVWEWQDSCQLAANDAGIECYKRGGAYNDPGWAFFNLWCYARYFNNVTTTSPDIGFRCCSP